MSMARTWMASVLAMVPLAAIAGAEPGPSAGGMDQPPPLSPCPVTFMTNVTAGRQERVMHLAVDMTGNTYITGDTDSDDLPTTAGAFDTSYNGSGDAFVIKVGPTGAIVFATYLGGGGYDRAFGIAVDRQGSVYMSGYSGSADFPTTPQAFDRTLGGYYDAVACKLSPDGRSMVYGTFLGGSDVDYAGGIAVDAGGRAFVSGHSASSDYPVTPGAFSTAHRGGFDGTVTALTPSGSTLVYSTFVGGSLADQLYGVVLDAGGNAHVTGVSSSPDFPTTPGCFQAAYGGAVYDAVVLKVAPTGAALAYATYLGGAGYESAYGLAIDATGAVYVTGTTSSLNFPVTPGAFDTALDGGSDTFVAKLAPGGSALFYATFVGGGSLDDGWDVGVDASGNASIVGGSYSLDFPITAGACHGSQGDFDAVAFKLDPAGQQQLYGTYIGTAGGPDLGGGVALDVRGRMHVAGVLSRASYDIFVATFR